MREIAMVVVVALLFVGGLFAVVMIASSSTEVKIEEPCAPSGIVGPHRQQ